MISVISYIVVFIFSHLILDVDSDKDYPTASFINHPLDSINHIFHSFNENLDGSTKKTLKLNPKPQSFSILMNFRQDGQQAVMLMDQQNGIYWSDAGFCRHGQMYDPVAKVCRR